MGNEWWLALGGIAMWAVLLAVMVFGKPSPNTCPSCGHVSSEPVCDEMVDANGWASDPCGCRNDYHT
jgi:hypothetical protein